MIAIKAKAIGPCKRYRRALAQSTVLERVAAQAVKPGVNRTIKDWDRGHSVLAEWGFFSGIFAGIRLSWPGAALRIHGGGRQRPGGIG
ncbi:hypothetical protein, partial [Pseudomonas protegens]|uniref:hypothetical protein n=1 Tax=Pseudomonas protegens TaxID=380021 RepID=UPI001CA53C1C